jgi:hypothetical protein
MLSREEMTSSRGIWQYVCCNIKCDASVVNTMKSLSSKAILKRQCHVVTQRLSVVTIVVIISWQYARITMCDTLSN